MHTMRDTIAEDAIISSEKGVKKAKPEWLLLCSLLFYIKEIHLTRLCHHFGSVLLLNLSDNIITRLFYLFRPGLNVWRSIDPYFSCQTKQTIDFFVSAKALTWNLFIVLFGGCLVNRMRDIITSANSYLDRILPRINVCYEIKCFVHQAWKAN